ncbi:uncharacterized protein LOC121803359 [Salvia splendens]|nr:uncharacterized protein LOC121803359 [Salvia splendens]
MKQSGSKTSPSHHPPNFTRLVSQPEELPNYMKSTISADARRNRSKVSTARQTPRMSPGHSSSHTTNSTKSCLTSRQESTLVEKSTTLDVLWGSLEVARATCSSTLKGSKFPDYLEGGAGLQGTSGLKVCPCNYCSLNGHLRALVPPLKCFVPARKRELKAKRSIKMKCQTPNATSTGTKCKAIKHDKDCMEDECNQLESFSRASTKDSRNEPLNSIEDECSIVQEFNPRNKAMPETEDERSTRATVKSEKSNQESEEPLEHDQGAEKVNLRHQEPEARKNAEEWMVDYAVREAVTKGGTHNQRKVMLLVEAFERVLPTSKH